jgi:hypothetical protein
MYTPRLPLSLFLVLLVISILTPRAHTATPPCPCLFDVPPDEEADCRVYGQLGDGNLIPWYRASQDCLDAYNIKDQVLDEDTVWRMCPYVNGTNINTDEFTILIRFDTSTTANAARLYYPEFFTGDSNQAVLNASIVTDDGIYIDCQAEATRCWNRVKVFVVQQSSRLVAFCQDLHKNRINSIEKEQSFARIRICEENNSTDGVCEPLAAQVEDIKGQQTNQSWCSAFGLGPASYPLPNASTCGTDDTSSNGSREVGSSGADFVRLLVSLAVSGIAVSYLLFFA